MLTDLIDVLDSMLENSLLNTEIAQPYALITKYALYGTLFTIAFVNTLREEGISENSEFVPNPFDQETDLSRSAWYYI